MAELMIHPPLRFLLWALGLALLGLKLLDLYGQWRWHQKTQTLYDRLGAEASRSANRNPPRVDFRELQPLPEIVQRYLGQVLTEGQPLMTTVIAQHQGQFNLGAETPRWFPFTSQQRISLHPAGFVWNGRITVLPGLVQIWVHDAYVGGGGNPDGSPRGLGNPDDLAGSANPSSGRITAFFSGSGLVSHRLFTQPGRDLDSDGGEHGPSDPPGRIDRP
jgi:hypothetical protein